MAESPAPHLILVGLPGAGKSVVGALVARALGRAFVDFDVEIARRAGAGIAELFASRGEPHFRDLEHALTAELRDQEGLVLAPGGGWIMRPDTVALVRPPARLVYLCVTPATAERRMGTAIGLRPLLRRPDPLAELEQLLAVRRTAYESADQVIDVEHLAPEQVTREIVDGLRTGEQPVGSRRLTTPLP